MRLGRLDGETEVSSSSISADRVAGPFTLATGNKDVSLDRISGDISVTNRNGEVNLTAAQPLGNITIENRNGQVELTLPDKANFSIQADTTNGDLENDFGLQQQGSDDSNHKSYNGTVGKGGPLIRISTSQQDIAIKKASIAPMPPAPPEPPAPISLHDSNGSSVEIGRNGINIRSEDGSTVIADRNGLHITTKSDGSSVYENKRTRLVTGADKSVVYEGADGTHYTSAADGSKTYRGRDGARIRIDADGSRTGTGPDGRTLSDSEINNRLRQAERDVARTAAERDAAAHKR
jgi:hypothetical protein